MTPLEQAVRAACAETGCTFVTSAEVAAHLDGPTANALGSSVLFTIARVVNAKQRDAKGRFVAGVQSVKRGPDFSYDGTYHVTLDNGDVHGIYRDSTTGWWRHNDPKDRTNAVSDLLSTETKDDALKALVARQDKYNPIVNAFNPDQPRDARGRFGSGNAPSLSYAPNPHVDHDGDGITDAARIGVPGKSVPPPPGIPRLPNLTPTERLVEAKFAEHYEKAPDEVAAQFRRVVYASTKPGEPATFGTDDAKVLTDAWGGSDLAVRSANRATLNCVLHQTANAIAKRAFLQHLDSLKPGDDVMVTVGGCGAGKGYALKNVPEALAVKMRSKAVWDSAGDQNATENPWIQGECEKRGLKANYIFVHADPYTQWAHPKKGVVSRAGDPNDGRMVDANVFADSYAIGAKNFQAFHDKHKDNPNASFTFLDNTDAPKLIDGVPKHALNLDANKLAEFARATVRSGDAPDHVKKGATVGERIWEQTRNVERDERGRFASHSSAHQEFNDRFAEGEFGTQENKADEQSKFASYHSTTAERVENEEAQRDKPDVRRLRMMHTQAEDAHRAALKLQKQAGADADVVAYHKDAAQEHKDRLTELGGGQYKRYKFFSSKRLRKI